MVSFSCCVPSLVRRRRRRKIPKNRTTNDCDYDDCDYDDDRPFDDDGDDDDDDHVWSRLNRVSSPTKMERFPDCRYDPETPREDDDRKTLLASRFL